jgi:hypothetical protein
MSLNASHLIPSRLPVPHQIDSQHAPHSVPVFRGFHEVAVQNRQESATRAAYTRDCPDSNWGIIRRRYLRRSCNKGALIGDYRILWR